MVFITGNTLIKPKLGNFTSSSGPSLTGMGRYKPILASWNIITHIRYYLTSDYNIRRTVTVKRYYGSAVASANALLFVKKTKRFEELYRVTSTVLGYGINGTVLLG